MRTPENIEYIKSWLAFGQENLLYAQSGMKEDFAPYHSICFMSQGSAEKYLKAFLIYHDWELEKIHDLIKLQKHCIEFDASFKSLLPECRILNKYITTGRYPGEFSFMNIGKQQAEEAIQAAQEIEKLVLEKIDL
jgi:HEPN domain-containing protein